MWVQEAHGIPKDLENPKACRSVWRVDAMHMDSWGHAVATDIIANLIQVESSYPRRTHNLGPELHIDNWSLRENIRFDSGEESFGALSMPGKEFELFSRMPVTELESHAEIKFLWVL